MENLKTKAIIKREKIIDAAVKVFLQKGFEKATVREIAREAGITTGAIYHHYRNKDELIHDAVTKHIHFISDLNAYEGDSLKPSSEIIEEIKVAASKRLSNLTAQRLHILLTANVLLDENELLKEYKETYESTIKKASDMFIYTYGVENERYKKLVASILVAALDGFAIQAALGILDTNDEEAINTITDFFAKLGEHLIINHK